MAKALDKIVVVDVESTCWEGAPRGGEVSEIIEVGVCLLDLGSLEREDKESVLVKPVRSRVSAFCTRLTTLTQAEVDLGVQFMDACNLLKKKYLSHRRTFASWGDYDRKMFEGQCRDMGVPYPFSPTHLNVKNLFTLLNPEVGRELGLERALQHLGLPLEGTHHRGHDDAWNIAAVLAHLLRTGRKPRSPSKVKP